MLFLLAAVTYLTAGVWLALFPNSFFGLLQMPRPDGVALWQGLGLWFLLGGVALAFSALRLDRATPMIAIVLAGTVLGAIGWLVGVISGQWPLRTLALMLITCIAWWLPFGLFLLEGTAVGARLRALAPISCAGLNLLGVGALIVVLKPGSEAVSDTASRINYITNNPLLWRGGWACWIAAALSLLAFYAWWGTRLPSWGWGAAALVIASAGVAFDLVGDSLSIGWLPRDFATVAPLTTLIAGGPANGLYTVAGVLLTIGTRSIKGWLAVWTWSIWAIGIGLAAFSFAGIFLGIAVSTAILFSLFCPWVVVMGRKLA